MVTTCPSCYGEVDWSLRTKKPAGYFVYPAGTLPWFKQQ
jgi:hypothetical protein